MLDLNPFCLPLLTLQRTKLRQRQNLGQNHREEGGGAYSQPWLPLSSRPWPCGKMANLWQVPSGRVIQGKVVSKDQAAWIGYGTRGRC